MGRRTGVGDNANQQGKEGKHNTKQEIIKDEALCLYMNWACKPTHPVLANYEKVLIVLGWHRLNSHLSPLTLVYDLSFLDRKIRAD